jgi:hypothetical protein
MLPHALLYNHFWQAQQQLPQCAAATGQLQGVPADWPNAGLSSHLH